MTNSSHACICIGHRGAAAYAPENTLASFAKAMELGVKHIELDVYRVESELLVFHDDRLERTTNGSGYLHHYSLSELRKLNAGQGQQIPTLQEVFELVDKSAAINIELKGAHTAAPVADFIRRAISNGWRREQILVSSFNHRELKQLRMLDPDIMLGALMVALPVDDAAFATALGAYSVHLSQEFIDTRFIADAHARGLKVYVFTANHSEDIQRMIALGVDGIFSDFPDRVLSLLGAPQNPCWV